MPIQISCPECGKKYRFPDEKAGNTVDCRECGAEIELPGGSRRKTTSRDDDGDEIRPKRKTARKSGRKGKSAGSPPVMWILGGIGGLLIVVILAVVVLRRPAAIEGQPGAGTPSTPNGATPGTEPPPGSNSTVAVKSWSVKVDPPTGPLAVNAGVSFQIATKAEHGLSVKHLLYPVVPSPFVLVGNDSSSSKKPRELWNLATGSKVRDVPAIKLPASNVGLSPDGKLLAWYRYENGGGLDVYDTEAGKIVVSIPLPSGQINISSVSLPTSQRLVIASTVHRQFMTWKIPSGEAERTISLSERAQPNDYLTFSPGGRYAAFTGDFLAQSLQFQNLDTGEPVGTIEFSERMSNKGLVGLAFSPDGAEVAAAYGQNNGATSDRIVICNVANGTIAGDFFLPDPDQRPLDFGGHLQTLQWFPSRKRLLQNGQHLIDRESRRVVYSLPRPTLDLNSQVTRHVLSDSVIAAWEGTKDSAALAPMPVKESDIARAREVAASGGMVIDARLPKLTALDRKRAVDKSDCVATWKVQPDPCSNPATMASSIPLTAANDRGRELKFSRLDSARAALRFAKDEDRTKALLYGSPRTVLLTGTGRTRRRYNIEPVTCRQNGVELFDLVQGKSLGRIEIDFPCELVALSPSGSRVLVDAMDGQGRLDAFSIPEGTHLAGCRPFSDEAKAEHREIEVAVFLDENTVAACSRNDQLLVFKLPGCEPVYAVQDAGVLALSPGGKLLATCAEGKIEFRDALTGDGRGSVSIGGETAELSFSPNGDRLAVLTSSASGSQVSVIELKEGSMSSLSIPAARSPLFWIGGQQLLVGGDKSSDLIHRKSGSSTIDRHLMLVDLRHKAVLWSYDHGTGDRVTFGNSTVDGRLWVAGAPKRGNTSKLTALSIPEPFIAARLADKSLEALVAVKPGMSVALQFGVTDPPELPGFAQQVRSVVDSALRNNELTVQDGQPIKLAIAATVANVPGKLELQLFGGTPGAQLNTVSLQQKAVTIRVTYEANGRTLWESKQDISNANYGLVTIEGKTPQQAIDEQMWKRAIEVFRQSQPPSHVLTGATNRGLGTSRLAGDGAFPPD